MNANSYEDLVRFLNQKITKSGMSQREFAQSLRKIDPSEEEFYTSILNRLLSPKGNTQTPRRSTLEKIAKIVIGRPDATVEQLWEVVYSQTTDRRTTLRVGAGFTCWSSLVLHMISESDDFPEGIEFVFCNQTTVNPDTREEISSVPYFMSKPEHVEAMRKKDPILHYSYRYSAKDLRALLDNDQVDCAFLLRSSYDQIRTEFKKNVPPIMHCRTAVGHGSHMYVIRVKELIGPTESEKKPDELQNDILALDDYDKRLAAYERFLDQVDKKRVWTITIGNLTVSQHYNDLVNRARAKQALGQHIRRNDIDINGPHYLSTLQTVAEQMLALMSPESDRREIEVFIVVAFEPLTNTVYRDLGRLFQQELVAQKITAPYSLIYTNYNVSKMVSDRSAYGLYSQVSTVDNPAKLVKANQLLNAINNHVQKYKKQLNTVMGQALADLYYPDTDDETIDSISKLTRMIDALKDIDFNTNALPFVSQVTTMIDKLSRTGTSPQSTESVPIP